MTNIKFDLTIKDGWLLNSLTYYSKTPFKTIQINSGADVLQNFHYFILRYAADMENKVPDNYLPLYFATSYNDVELNLHVSASMATSHLLAAYKSKRFTNGLQLELKYEQSVPIDCTIFANIVSKDEKGFFVGQSIQLNSIEFLEST